MKTYTAVFVPDNKEILPFWHKIEAFNAQEAEGIYNLLASMWKGKFQEFYEQPT